MILLAVVGLQVGRIRGVFEDDDHVVADAGRGVDALVEEGELGRFSLWWRLWGGTAVRGVVGGDVLF